ncbi:phenoloxidase-activating factor 2-like [Pectinophora gossypiella]|uniref:phenoloxidase-activating factor 2-like n=1 Tax=Pectinophora gossypiella TaxID=13191 RepID=UPI00214F35CB|nr:phenoloxidase-activating factor 2-like [Pectinophora gossypiella]XP_049883412.1 phenoloxidase-activating factor 2-like [Pectinophora gossypiella]XP_049883413.1 phenoloxidase-activating factor 2-like [Pectinophora gossypiella]
MYFIILSCLTACALAQTTIDPNLLIELFGTPQPPVTPTPNTTTRLEDITVKPTDKTTTFTDVNGEACKCVPYYLCDNELNDVNSNNASVTGYGTLDIRFGEDDCQESIERCCKNPKKEEEVTTPAPNPNRPKGCGYRNPKGLDFTITGGSGNEAQFGEFPWVVAVLDALNDTYAGVGVLIHPRVVLTGAHIANKYAPGTLKIRAGEWDTQTFKERLKYQERVAQDIYIHQEFAPKSLKNDMALLLLQEPVELMEHINIICMPTLDENFDRYKGCIANGWGKNHFGVQGRYAVILKKVEIDMVPNDRCQTLLQRTRLGTNFKLHNSFVCAGGEPGKDTCQGDGGAPLACPIGNDRYKLTGLVAWGIGCGQKDVPAVYAAVARFRRWVDDKMAAWGLDISGYNV